VTRIIYQFQYQLIAQEIKDIILKGDLMPGSRLDSERDLCRQFQVQRNTIRRALELLEVEGHISIRGRRGSFVLPPAQTLDKRTLLVNVHSGAAPNITALVDGFGIVAKEQGFESSRTSNNPLPDSNVNLVPQADSMPADIAGMLIWPHFPIDVAEIRKINERIPVVLVDQRIMGISTDCVRSDDVAGGKKVAEHLLHLGHRRIAFLTDEVFAESVQARWQGYVLAHEEAGVFCDPKLSLLYQFIDAGIFEPTMRLLWGNPEIRPTAIMCSNDVVAFLLLRFLHAEGIRVPEDIAVTGYGNSMPDYTAAVSLTTIDQPFFEVGREAARLLCKRVRAASSDRFRSPQDIVLPVHLEIRGSTSAGVEVMSRKSRRR